MGGKTSKSTSEQRLPPQWDQAYTNFLAQAQQTAAQPFKPYTGGFTQDQQTAYRNIGNLAGAANPWYDQARVATQQAAGANRQALTPTYQTVGSYMSPYTSGVVNATMANINEQNAQQQQSVLGNAMTKGAFGGDRVGVAQAQLARAQDLASNQTIADLRNQGYNTALGAAQADKGAALQAAGNYNNQANTLGSLGSAQMQGNLAQAMAQLQAGNQQQNFNYQQYQNERSYPFQAQGWLGSLLQGLGSTVGGNTTNTQPSGNTASSILGGLTSLFGLFSDERMKEGAVPVGKTFDGQTIYKYRYKGDATPQIGLMAQEVEREHPEAVGERDGFKTVNYDLATKDAERERRAMGGVIPYQDGSPEGVDMFASYVPQMQIGGGRGSFGESNVGQNENAGVGPHSGPQGDPTKGLFGSTKNNPAGANASRNAIASLFPVKAGGIFADGGHVAEDAPGYAFGGALGFIPEALGKLFHPSAAPAANFNDRFAADTAGAKDLIIPPSPQAFEERFNSAVSGAKPLVQPAGIRIGYDVKPTVEGGAGSGVSGVIPGALPVRRAVQTERISGLTEPAGEGVVASTPPLAPALPPPVTLRPRPVASVPDVVQSPLNAKAARPYAATMAAAEQARGLPPGYLAQTAQLESSFNPNAVSDAGAEGLFQFVPSTAAQYGLKNPRDVDASIEAAASLSADNQRALAAGLGRQPTPGELYLAHQQGASGALNLLTHPNDAASSVVGAKAVTMNGGTPDMTAGQFARQWTSKFDGLNERDSGDPQLAYAAETRSADPAAGVIASGGAGADGVVRPTPVVFGAGKTMGGWNPLNLSDDVRSALITAGLGAMAGTSPNALTNIGTGGLQGMEAYNKRKEMARDSALAQNRMAIEQGTLGLEGKRVDLAGQALLNETARTKADIEQQTAHTAQTEMETQRTRFEQTPTPAGMVIRDLQSPGTYKLVPWDQLQTVTGAGAANAPSSGVMSGTAPATKAAGQSSMPPTSAPRQEAVRPDAQISDVTGGVQLPPKMPIDARLFSPTGQSVVSDETQQGLSSARANYQASIATNQQLTEMQHDLAALPNSWLTQQGALFPERLKFARAINTFSPVPIVDEQAVAAGEDLNKLTTRLGQELARRLGSDQAASIVEGSIAAVPGGINSPEGAKRIINGLKAANQRQVDYYQFLQHWATKTGGSIAGADQYFNQLRPPELYGLMAVVPPPAIQYLREHPDAARDFEDKYGQGTSRYVLTGE